MTQVVLVSRLYDQALFSQIVSVQASIRSLLDPYLTRDILPALGAMTGKVFEVRNDSNVTNVVRVRVNGALARQEYTITGTIATGPVVIEGGSWLGCKHGLYAWLNEIGVYQLAPGDRWRVTPSRADLRQTISVARAPAFDTADGGGQGTSSGSSWPFDQPTKYQTDWRARLDWQGLPNGHYVSVSQPEQNFGSHNDTFVYAANLVGWDADPDHFAQPYAAWQASHYYFPGEGVVADGKRYTCTAEGESASSGSGPSGTGAGITDNDAVWDYEAAGTRVSGVGDFHQTHTGKVLGVEHADYDDLNGGIGLYAGVLLSAIDANVAGLSGVPSLAGAQMNQSAAVGDGHPNCRCAKCVNLLRSGFGLSVDSSATDTSVWRAGRIYEAIKAQRPSLSLEIVDWAYDRQSAPPTAGWSVNQHVRVLLAQNSFRKDGISTSILRERWAARATLDGFKIGAYDYWALPTFVLSAPRFSVAQAWRNVREWIADGFTSFSGESTYSTGAVGVHWWGLYQLLWRGPSLTTDDLLSDFCEKAFGAGAAHVKRTFDRWWAREWPSYAPNAYELGLAFDDLKQADDAVIADAPARARVVSWMAYLIFLHYHFRWYDTAIYSATAPSEEEADEAAGNLLRHTWRAAQHYMADAKPVQDSVISSSYLSAGFVSDWTIPGAGGYADWRAANAITDYTDAEIRTLFETIRATYPAPTPASYTTPTASLTSPYTPTSSALVPEGWQYGHESAPQGYEYVFQVKSGATDVFRVNVQATVSPATTRFRLYNAVTGALLETLDLDVPLLKGANEMLTKDYSLTTLATGFYRLQIELTHPSIGHRVQHHREMPLVRVGAYARSAWGGSALPVGEPAGTDPHYFFVPKNVTAFHIFAMPDPGNPTSELIVRDGDDNVVTPTMLGDYVYKYEVAAGQDKKVWRYEGYLSQGPAHGTPRILDIPEWTAPTREQIIVPANLWAE